LPFVLPSFEARLMARYPADSLLLLIFLKEKSGIS
jgi:hypothetical protein